MASKKKLFGFGKKNQGGGSSKDPVDEKFIAMMDEMKLPASARENMLKMDKAQKLKMIEQHNKKKVESQSKENQKLKKSGTQWSKEFNNPKKIGIDSVKEFTVVLNDSNEKFVMEFITEMGLTHLCKLSEYVNSTNANNLSLDDKRGYDYHILNSFKSIMDVSLDIIKQCTQNNKFVSTVTSQTSSTDDRTRVLSLRLLVTVAYADDDCCEKILLSLQDNTRKSGYRNRWTDIVRNMPTSTDRRLDFEYNMYALQLINIVIGGLESLEERTDERRLLNALKFDQKLASVKQDESEVSSKLSNDDEKIDTRIISYLSSLNNQIQAYEELRKEDRSNLDDLNDEFDLNNPIDLFKKIHDQCLEDGYINELMSILKDLILLPPDAEKVWSNLKAIVKEACKPIIKKSYFKKDQETVNYADFKTLQNLLNVKGKDFDSSSQAESKVNEEKLNEERQKNVVLSKEVNDLKKQLEELKKNPPVAAAGAPAPAPIGAPAPVPVAAPAADDGLDSFRKMQKMHVPAPAIANKMRSSGVDASVIEEFEKSGIIKGKAGGGGGGAPATAPAPNPLAAGLAAAANKKGKGIGGLPTPPKIGDISAKKPAPKKAAASKPPSLKNELPPNLKPKKKINPGASMKKLQWVPIKPNLIEGTIFDKIDDSKVKFDTKLFESKFGTKESAKKNTPAKVKSPKAGTKKEKSEKISVLDGKRGYNIEIFLGRLKLSPYDLRTWVLNMDEKKLDVEKVTKLIPFTPKPEEAELYEGYENEKNLSKADQYFNVIRTVDSNVPQRLELWAFKMNFDTVVNDEKEKITMLLNGIKCVQSNDSYYIKSLFSIILAMGNYMNANTNKGGAYGFKLSSLAQLSRSKSVDGSQSLLEYIYEHFEKNDKKFLNIKKDWQNLEQSTKVDLPTLKQHVNQIQAKLNLINRRISAESQPKGDKFKSVMQPFYNKANKEVDDLKKSMENALKSLKSLAESLGEKNDVNGEFLKSLLSFYKSFTYLEVQLKEKRERQQRAANKKAAASDKAVDKSPSNKKGHTAAPSMKVSAGKGAGDQLIGALMDTNANSFMMKLKQRREKMAKKGKK